MEEVKKLLDSHENRMSYGGPLVGRDEHVHERSAIHALLWAIGAPKYAPPSKGIRGEDRLQRM